MFKLGTGEYGSFVYLCKHLAAVIPEGKQMAKSGGERQGIGAKRGLASVLCAHHTELRQPPRNRYLGHPSRNESRSDLNH